MTSDSSTTQDRPARGGWWWVLLAGVLLRSASLQAGVVQTLDGRRYQGEIGFGSAALRVALGDTKTVLVPLTNLLAAVFTDAGPDSSLLGPLSGGWTSTDVGDVTIAGRAGQSNDTFGIKVAGAGGEEESEGRHFVYQRVNGDAEIIARVTSIQGVDPLARASVTVRESPAAGCPFALLGVSGNGNLCFQARSEWSTKARTQKLGQIALPCWLRLVKKGKQFAAYHSADGRDWRPAGATNGSLGDSMLIGMALSSHRGFSLALATYDQVRLMSSRLPGKAQIEVSSGTARAEPAASRVFSARGLLLRSGSFLAGQVSSVDESAVKFAFRGEGEMTVPAHKVAVVFLRLPRRSPSREPGRLGVLLNNGDMFEGEFKRIEGRTVKISSVLFGLRSFRLDEVAAIILNPIAAGPAAYEIRTTDGSALQALSLAFRGDGVVCEEGFLGAVQLPKVTLVEIRRLGAEGRTGP